METNISFEDTVAIAQKHEADGFAGNALIGFRLAKSRTQSPTERAWCDEQITRCTAAIEADIQHAAGVKPLDILSTDMPVDTSSD